MLTKLRKNTGKSNLKPVRSRVDISQYGPTTTVLSVIDSFWYSNKRTNAKKKNGTKKKSFFFPFFCRIKLEYCAFCSLAILCFWPLCICPWASVASFWSGIYWKWMRRPIVSAQSELPAIRLLPIHSTFKVYFLSRSPRSNSMLHYILYCDISAAPLFVWMKTDVCVCAKNVLEFRIKKVFREMQQNGVTITESHLPFTLMLFSELSS